jgi:mRNA-degrading endonuclease RelE of RelBE toxin-antitoxin system
MAMSKKLNGLLKTKLTYNNDLSVVYKVNKNRTFLRLSNQKYKLIYSIHNNDIVLFINIAFYYEERLLMNAFFLYQTIMNTRKSTDAKKYK